MSGESRYDYTEADYPEPGCLIYNQCIEDLQFDPKLEGLGRAPTYFETIAEMLGIQLW